MLTIAIYLFLTGVALGLGPCLISCGPLLASYIGGTKPGPKQAIFVWAVFSLSRLAAYLVIGLIAGFIGQEFIYNVFGSGIAKILFILGGIFIGLIGLLIVLGKQPQIKLCERLNQKFLVKDTKSIVIFGLIVGFSPCGPLLAVIIPYVVLISDTWLKGLIYSFSFGMGTIISPLFILAVTAGLIPKFLTKKEKAYNIFQKICGIVIILLGIQLIINGINF